LWPVRSFLLQKRNEPKKVAMYDKEHIAHVCEPFFTTKEVGKGTGLGLSMVYGGVQSHGGEVIIDSEPGKGTAVRIQLPITNAVKKTQRRKLSEVSLPEQSHTILLADDEEMLREVMTESLEKLGYQIMAASDGAQAMTLFEEHADAIDLAILDVVMPHMGGVELSEHIHRLQPTLPVIFYTGYDQKLLQNSKFNHEQCRCIGKPVMIEELSILMKEMLQ